MGGVSRFFEKGGETVSALEEAKGLALDYVAARMRTKEEVREMLRKKGYGEEITEEVVPFLEEYHYVDDEAYCRSWIHDRMEFHPCGRMKMVYELGKKVKDSSLAEQTVAEFFSEEAEYEIALETALKKVRGTRKPVTREKLSRFLYGKGFSGDIIRSVVQDEAVENYLDKENFDNIF